MIVDTLVVVCLMVTPQQEVNRFEAEFQRADSLFAVIERASDEAMKSAIDKTRKQREKALSSFDVQVIIDKLKSKTKIP